MSLKVRLANIISPNDFTISYKTGRTPGDITVGFTSYGSVYSGGTTEVIISGVTINYETQYWFKLTDIVTDGYCITNLYTHVDDYFPCILVSLTPTPSLSELSPSATPSVTPSQSEISPLVTPTVTPSQSEISPLITPSVTPTITATPSITPTVTETPLITSTPSITPTITETPSITATPSITPTVTPSYEVYYNIVQCCATSEIGYLDNMISGAEVALALGTRIAVDSETCPRWIVIGYSSNIVGYTYVFGTIQTGQFNCIDPTPTPTITPTITPSQSSLSFSIYASTDGVLTPDNGIRITYRINNGSWVNSSISNVLSSCGTATFMLTIPLNNGDTLDVGVRDYLGTSDIVAGVSETLPALENGTCGRTNPATFINIASSKTLYFCCDVIGSNLNTTCPPPTPTPTPTATNTPVPYNQYDVIKCDGLTTDTWITSQALMVGQVYTEIDPTGVTGNTLECWTVTSTTTTFSPSNIGVVYIVTGDCDDIPGPCIIY